MMPEINMPKLITVKELQDTLSINRDLAYRLVRRRDFPSVKLGKEYRIISDDLPGWLRKQQRNK